MRFGFLAHRVLPVLAVACIVVLTACRGTPAGGRAAIADDFGDTLVTGAAPARIVSLNPTTTEMLFSIGAGRRLVGRTTYDVLPVAARAIPDMGPGIRPNVEAVLAARPDLVILYASDDNRNAARKLRAAGVPTVAFRIDRIADFARVTHALGALTGDTAAARTNVAATLAALARVRAATASLPRPSVFWPLWDSPLLAMGGGSFLNELVNIAGGRNIYDSLAQPSPAVSLEDVLRRDPDVLVAGARSRQRYAADARWQGLRAVRAGRIVVVDSFLATGPTDRIGASAASLARLLHPGALP